MDSATLWSSLLLTAQLAAGTTVILLVLGTPLAWWLGRSPWRWKTAVEAVVALPLVLPPTVLGFYLLLALGPQGLVGAPWFSATGSTLTFSFTGHKNNTEKNSLPF